MTFKRTILPLWAKFDADWPCLWSENVVGTKPLDGIKWGCGLQLLTEPCIIYSIGSKNQWNFEEGVGEIAPQCKIFTFDPTFPKEKITVPLSIQRNVQYFEIGIIGHSDEEMKKYQTLPAMMSTLKHNHIDVLKIDVDGYEWPVFFDMENAYIEESLKHSSIFNSTVVSGESRENCIQSWPSIGQIYIEFHTNRTNYNSFQKNKTFRNMIDVFEEHGFRIFHKEVNMGHADCCSEYSFIQSRWEPSMKHYSMCN